MPFNFPSFFLLFFSDVFLDVFRNLITPREQASKKSASKLQLKKAGKSEDVQDEVDENIVAVVRHEIQNEMKKIEERFVTLTEKSRRYFSGETSSCYDIFSPYLAQICGVSPLTGPKTDKIDFDIRTLKGKIAVSETNYDAVTLEKGTAVSQLDSLDSTIQNLNSLIERGVGKNLEEFYSTNLDVLAKEKKDIEKSIESCNTKMVDIEASANQMKAELCEMEESRNDMMAKIESDHQAKVTLLKSVASVCNFMDQRIFEMMMVKEWWIGEIKKGHSVDFKVLQAKLGASLLAGTPTPSPVKSSQPAKTSQLGKRKRGRRSTNEPLPEPTPAPEPAPEPIKKPKKGKSNI